MTTGDDRRGASLTRVAERVAVQWQDIPAADHRRLKAVIAKVAPGLGGRRISILAMDPIAVRYLDAVADIRHGTVILLTGAGDRLRLMPGGRIALVGQPWPDDAVEDALRRVAGHSPSEKGSDRATRSVKSPRPTSDRALRPSSGATRRPASGSAQGAGLPDTTRPASGGARRDATTRPEPARGGKPDSGTHTRPLSQQVAVVRAGTVRRGRADDIGTGRDLIGSLVDDRYRLEELLGRGGFATVYKARHEVLGVPVAVKILRSSALADQRSIDMLLSEARSVARIRHPNIVRILDAARSAARVYIAMEFVDGWPLSSWLEQSGRVDAPRALRIAAGVCHGLAAALGQGIIHCDIKPSNVMIDRQLNPLLVDFGLARPIAAQAVGGRVAGSPSYMAPEQASESARLDHRTDIYGLGCSLFHVLTGRVPYPGNDPITILMAHAREPVPDVRSLAPDLDSQIATLVAEMMAKRPADRPSDYGELIRRLEELAERSGGGSGSRTTLMTDLFAKLWARTPIRPPS